MGNDDVFEVVDQELAGGISVVQVMSSPGEMTHGLQTKKSGGFNSRVA